MRGGRENAVRRRRRGQRTAAALAAVLLASGAPAVAGAADGKALYEANCGKCHGSTGMADTASAKTLEVPKLDDPQLAGEGGADLVTRSVRENAKHASVSKKLGDEELAAVAEYVRQLAAPGD